jgi:predicted Zn finger-like uncharacterized protein
MNIQCEQCKTQYQISDTKVIGKDRVFKIRCKNCSAIITFNGLESREAESNLSDATQTDQAVWYYVKDGQQEGPLSISDLRVARAEGLVDTGTYVWRSGMDDWHPLESVSELGSLLTEPAMLDQDDSTELPSRASDNDRADHDTEMAATAPTAATTPSSVETAYDPDATMIDQPLVVEPSGDTKSSVPTEATPPTESVEHENSPATSDDLFTPRDAEEGPALEQDSTLDNLFVGGSSAKDAAALGESSKASPSDSEGMVWQRHDNSVLFSLNDSEDTAPVTTRSAPRKPERQDAFAALPQDSGLIDIRSFSKKKKERAAATGDLFASLAGDGSENEMPTGPLLGAAPTASIPVIQRRKGGGAALYAAIVFGIVALGAIAALVFIVIKKDDPPAATTLVANAKQDEQPRQQEVASTTGAPKIDEAATKKPAKPAEQPKEALAPTQANARKEQAAAPEAAQPEGATEPNTVAAIAPESDEVAPKSDKNAEVDAKIEAAGDSPAADEAPSTTEKPPEEVAEPKKPRTAAERRRWAKLRERYRKRKAEANAKAKATAAAKAEKAAAAKAAAAKAAAAKKNPPKVDPNALLKKMGTPPPKPASAASSSSAGGAELPAKPTTSQVKKTMRSGNSRIRSCVKGAGESGKVVVSFRISPGGGTSGISVSGTSAGGCIKGVVRGLRFPKSKQGRSVRFPFSIK